MIQILWSSKYKGIHQSVFWGLVGTALLFSLVGCSLFSEQSTVGRELKLIIQEPIVLKGNWWSDGTYRVNRRNPNSVAQMWADQEGAWALMPFTEMTGLPPETGTALDEKCRVEARNDLAFWLGWAMNLPNPFPQKYVCFSGVPHSDIEIGEVCASIFSRGRPLVMAWNKAKEFEYACREP